MDGAVLLVLGVLTGILPVAFVLGLLIIDGALNSWVNRPRR